MVRIFGLLPTILCGVAAATQHQVERKSATDAHQEMVTFLKENPFKLDYPVRINKLFAGRLVKSIDGFSLPPGQVWPFPTDWWKFTEGWTHKVLSVLWPIYVWYNTATRYSVELIQHRLPNAGLGYMTDIGRNGHKEHLLSARSLERRGLKDTSDWRYEMLMASTSMYHSAVDDYLLVELLEELCRETTLTPLQCTDLTATDPWKSMIRNLLMFSYFRLGENENCRENHSFESCLMPLKGLAIHTRKHGSESAIRYLLIELAAHPDNLAAKWLLNLAHMTLGSYPADVPSAHRLDPKLLESDEDVGVFHNVAELLGISTFSSKGTGIVDDFLGNDGLKDIFQCSTTYNTNVKLFKNMGNNQFSDVTEAAGLLGIDGGSNCRHTDYNNDGHLDLFIVRGGWFNIDHYNSLIRNNGDGTFTDVTLISGIVSRGASHTVDFADVNRDGLLDIFVGNEDIPCELWLNSGADDKFVNVANSVVRACGLLKAMTFTDMDDDMNMDIFISNYAEPNAMLHNNGRWSLTEPGTWDFSDVTSTPNASEVANPRFSFPVASFDADQDGSLDLLVAGHIFEGPDAIWASYTGDEYFMGKILKHEDKVTQLFLNKKITTAAGTATHTYNAIPTIQDGKPGAGGLQKHYMSMAVNYGDIDNDGYLDLYFGTGQPEPRAIQSNKMYRNAGDGIHWLDVTSSANLGHLQKGHGISFADIDNDGDLDIYSQVSKYTAK